MTDADRWSAEVEFAEERTFAMSITRLAASEPQTGRLGRLAQSFSSWRSRRAQERALQALDDRTLADIGLGRTEIGSVVAEANGLAERTRRRFLTPTWAPRPANREAAPIARPEAA